GRWLRFRRTRRIDAIRLQPIVISRRCYDGLAQQQSAFRVTHQHQLLVFALLAKSNSRSTEQLGGWIRKNIIQKAEQRRRVSSYLAKDRGPVVVEEVHVGPLPPCAVRHAVNQRD